MASDLEMQEATDYARIERQLRAEIDTLRGTRDELKAALAIERERAEKAEREIAEIKALSEQYMEDIGSAYAYVSIRDYAFAKSSLAEAKALLKVFADVAEQDIDEIEKDADRFVPMRTYNKAPLLTVGDLRAAARFLAQEEGRPTEEPQR